MWRLQHLSFSAILLALIVLDPLAASAAFRALRPGGKRVRSMTEVNAQVDYIEISIKIRTRTHIFIRGW